MERLLISIKPYSGECINSYILRLAYENRYPHPSWIFQKIGLESKNVFHVVSNSMYIENLSILTGVSVDILNKLTYLEDKIYKKNTYPINHIDTKYSSICPLCFRNKPFQKKHWNKKMVTACPIHHCKLINKCSNCNFRIRHVRSNIYSCECGMHYKDLPVEKAGKPAIEYSRLINNKRGDIRKICPPLKDLSVYHLLYLSSKMLDEVNKIFGRLRWSYYEEEKNNEFQKDKWENIIKDIFTGWPWGLKAFINEYRNECRDILGHEEISSRGIEYLYDLFYSTLADVEYDFLRKKFEEHFPKYLLAERKFDKNAYTLETLKNYGLDYDKITKLIEENKVLGHRLALLNDYFVIWDNSFKSYVSYMQRFTTTKEGSEILGLDEDMIRILVEHCILYEDRFLEELNGTLLRKKDIEEVRDILIIKANRINKLDDNLSIGADIIHLLKEYSLDIGHLYKMIYRNQINTYYLRENKGHLLSYYFNIRQIQNYIIDNCRK